MTSSFSAEAHLLGRDRGLDAERDKGADDELQSRQEELMVSLAGVRNEAIKVCPGHQESESCPHK